jgi:acyl-CoA dehydrogenase-like protein
MSAALDEARSFAESVAGVLSRHPGPVTRWAPGAACTLDGRELTAALDALGWAGLAGDRSLATCAGLAGIELGRACAPLHLVDRLLGGSPLAGDLVRSLAPLSAVLTPVETGPARRSVVAAVPCPSAAGLDVHRVTALGDAVRVPREEWEPGWAAWLAAGVGYLAGLGAGALDLTLPYVTQRRAFGTMLGQLAPVQQQLAGAATAVRGVALLAAADPDADALVHAGEAVAEACAICHQVTGAIGFTLEYPLHGYTQRARALAIWNEAIVEAFGGYESLARRVRTRA